MDTNSSGAEGQEHGAADRYLTPVAVVLGAVIIGAALYFGHGSAPTQTGTQQAAGQPSVNIADIKMAGDPYIGQADAPVTIAFWSDYQCPYCKAFEVGGISGVTTPPALPDIIKNYVDTGKVKVVFMDFPFLGGHSSNPSRDDSTTAALYGRAVWKLYPKQYFAWRTAMYKAQDQEGDVGFGDAASIDKLDATIPGLDAAKIKADVAANAATYQAAIDADKAELVKIEGSQAATPSFVIGTQLLKGAYPYAAFRSAIEAAASK